MAARPMPTGFGAFSWQQLNTTDLAAAGAFYTSLFGWETRREVNESMAQWGPFAIVKQGGRDIATLMQMPAEAESQSHWLSYVGVEDIAASFAKMQALGGTAFVPPRVIPGVGAFANAMGELQRRGLDQVTRDVAARGTPLMGICLGMQLLFDESEEFGVTPGLGLIDGRVVAIPSRTENGEPQKVPHIGWNEILPFDVDSSWSGSILEDVSSGDAAYFVHSFMAKPTDDASRLADVRYGGAAVSAVVARANVSGCQFHPEKSGKVGLTVLRRFLAL